MSQQNLISDEEFERAWNRWLMRDPPLPSVPIATPTAAYPFKLEDVVRESIRELRQELGKKWLPNRIFGTRLHAIVRSKIDAIAPAAGWMIAAEQPLRTFVHMPSDLVNLSLDQYLMGSGGHLYWLKDDLKRTMKLSTLIGDLKPDLVIRGPDLVLTIWDLTSRERTEHLAKTILYANLLAGENQLTRIGETYWVQRGEF